LWESQEFDKPVKNAKPDHIKGCNIYNWMFWKALLTASWQRGPLRFTVLSSGSIQHHFQSSAIKPLLVQFKALLHGQKGCVFFSGHLHLRTTPETGLPSREKNHNN